MTPQLGGTLESLQVDLVGRQLRLVLERRGPAAAPLWLLLPALSTVSSRGEWKPLAEAVADQRQLVSFDWPGFGDSDRPAMPYDAALLRSALRAVLSYLRTTTRQRPTVIAAGHSASVALGLASEWSGLWQELVLVAPTWRPSTNNDRLAVAAVRLAAASCGSPMDWPGALPTQHQPGGARADAAASCLGRPRPAHAGADPRTAAAGQAPRGTLRQCGVRERQPGSFNRAGLVFAAGAPAPMSAAGGGGF